MPICEGLRNGLVMETTMEQRLIDAMRDEPDSVEPGLVYADWLEEQGDPRAELVRAGSP